MCARVCHVVCVADKEDDDLDLQVTRYKPDAIDSLCRSTKFNRKELKIMYRGFKQVRRAIIQAANGLPRKCLLYRDVHV